MLTHLAPHDIESGVFEVPGTPSAWIWVSTCPDRECDCRDLHILASDQGRQALLEQLSSIRKSLQIDRHYKDRTPPMGHLLPFNLDLDTAAVYLITNSRGTVDLSDDPQIGAIANRIDGDLLDRIDELWHRRRGLLTPEQLLTSADRILVEGWRPGGIIAWADLCPSARRDIYILGRREYEALEYYCPDTECTCGKIDINFQTSAPYRTHDPGSISVTPGAVSFEPNTESTGPLLQHLWAAFQTRHPRYAERFTRRYALVRSAGARFAPYVQTPSSTTKFGRNDPCPCGSSRKYKKCCDANRNVSSV